MLFTCLQKMHLKLVDIMMMVQCVIYQVIIIKKLFLHPIYIYLFNQIWWLKRPVDYDFECCIFTKHYNNKELIGEGNKINLEYEGEYILVYYKDMKYQFVIPQGVVLGAFLDSFTRVPVKKAKYIIDGYLLTIEDLNKTYDELIKEGTLKRGCIIKLYLPGDDIC